ncbi:hypothetical protein [Thalassotalea ganghwensis]
MTNTKHLFLYFIFLFFLTACGGGDSPDKQKPSPTPSPVINSFSTNKTSIFAGESVEITAVFSNGEGSINKGIGNVSSGVGIQISPEETTTYTLSVTNSNGQTITKLLTITVNTAPPEIVGFTASKTDIQEGEAIELIANFANGEGQVNGGIGAVSSNTAISVSPVATTTYTLTVTNAKGVSVAAQLTINVTSPHIGKFWTEYDAQILPGDSARLEFAFSGGEGSIDNAVGNVKSYEAILVQPEETTTYTLTVTNEFGASRTAQLTVEVLPVIIKYAHPAKFVKDEFLVAVGVYANIEVTEVSASIAGITKPLQSYLVTDEKAYFKETFSLSGMPQRDYTLTATAIDFKGKQHSFSKTITYDTPPQVTLSSTVKHGVATPTLALEASCTDELGDCEISIVNCGDKSWCNSINDGTVILSGQNQINASYDFSDYDGKKIYLLAIAKDELNQYSENNIASPIYVESSTELTAVNSFAGQIIDFNHDNVLLHNSNNSGDKLDIADVTNNTVSPVEIAPNTNIDIDGSFLTPTGAVYTVDDYYASQNLFDWNKNELLSLGQTRSQPHVSGDFMTYFTSDKESDYSQLWQRQFSTKTNVLASQRPPCRGSGCSSSKYYHSVASNGVITYQINTYYESRPCADHIMKFENNTETQLPNISSYICSPLSDGSRFIYQNGNAISIHDGINETMRTDSFSWARVPSQYRFYAINNGWAAYVDLGNLQQLHVFSQDINGVVQQRTFFGKDAYIEALAENGDIMVLYEGKRYLSKLNADPVFISSALGTSKYSNGAWYIALGNTLFSLTSP